MRIFWSDDQLAHREAHFIQAGALRPSPDSLSRARTIVEALRARGHRITAPDDHGRAPLLAVHTPDFLDFLETAHARWTAQFGADSRLLPNVHPRMPYDTRPTSIVGQLGWHAGDMACEIVEGTWRTVYASAQAAVSAVRQMEQDGGTHYALCRPPGHHAFADRAMGFCYLNNSAIAARALRRSHDRVAIVDVDVHHGNGTQGIFYECADVFTFSMHSDPAEYYPFFSGRMSERGTGAGEGFNRNEVYPFGSGDGPYLAALDRGLQAVADFAPDAIVLAMGVDASEHDPHGRHKVTRAGFAQMAQRVRSLGLPTVIVQEGGYESQVVGDLIDDVLHAFD